MKSLLFVLLISILISISFNFFQFNKLKNFIISYLIDLFILSFLIYSSIEIVEEFESTQPINYLLISFLFYSIIVFYIKKMRLFIYTLFLEKKRINYLEYMLNKKGIFDYEIYESEQIDCLYQDNFNKKVYVNKDFMDEMDDDLINLILLEIRINNNAKIIKLLAYFIPLLFFYLGSTHINHKTNYYLIGGSLIYILPRLIDFYYRKRRNSFDKEDLNKENLINALKKQNEWCNNKSTKIQKKINDFNLVTKIQKVEKIF